MNQLKELPKIQRLNPKGNYCSICDVHDQHCRHITGESVIEADVRRGREREQVGISSKE